jgi:hypothetical protein
MVAEVYGPTAASRRQAASDLMGIMEKTPDVKDVNTFMVHPHQETAFEIDRQHAAMLGVSVEDINREVSMAMGGYQVGSIKLVHELEQTLIVMQLPLALRANPGSLLSMPVHTATGGTVALGELGRFIQRPTSQPIFHKDLRAVEYVTGDVTGPLGAPLYGMMNVERQLKDYRTADGSTLTGSFFGKPKNLDVPSFTWDGEWQVTYVTFRDMGLAFAAALVLIYMLVVAEFRNFMLPLVVMAPIPLTLIGIIPGHWLLGADFTATSMIGFIALAGIIVRNSILLVDFAKSKVMEGMSVRDAVVLAAEVRMRPIIITALALVIGSMVLLTDPIFQGMAVSLLFGSIVATFLTLVVIPLGCLSAHKAFCATDSADSPGCATPNGTPPVTPSGGAAPSGRPPRLEKSSLDNSSPATPAAPSGRPPRLEKSNASATAGSLPTAPATTASGRPPRLAKKTEVQGETASSDPVAAPEALSQPVELPPEPDLARIEPVFDTPPETSSRTMVERAMQEASSTEPASRTKREPRGIRIKPEDEE